MKYVYELIGTFFLVFTIGMVVLEPGVPAGFAPIAIGTILAVMIFIGGHVSGGMYNPAVSLAVAVRGKMSYADMIIYWVAQVAGAAGAAYLVIYMKGAPATALLVPEMDMTKALIAEFVFTFVLTFTVLNVATAKGTEGNSFYGWAIGMSVLVGAFAVGAISGAAFNPAVAVGASLMGLFSWANIWIYLVAELAAGIVAALIFKAAHREE